MTAMRLLCLGLLALLLLGAAWTDIRARIIPNRLNAAIALLAIAWWWASGLAPWPGIAMQLAIGGGTLLLFTALFALGLIGGGDVKLLAALGLWLPLAEMAQMLTWMALVGGVLALVVLVVHRIRRIAARAEVPYGVAIVAATLPIVANRILTMLTA